MDPNLLAILEANGIDPSKLGGGTTTAVDPKDPPVFFGETRKYRADGDVLRHRGGKEYGGITTKPLTAANAAFYEMTEQQLETFQRRLVGAGILDPDKVRYGDYDDDTYSAFAAINERTAKFNAVGKKVTPNDVLGMIERAYVAGGGAPVETEPGRITPATSSLTLEEQVQQAARAQLGRKLKSSEVSKFVSIYQGMEGTFQATASAMEDEAAASGQNASIQQIPSADVAASQYIESNFAQEAAGQDAYGYLGALRNLLGG